MSAVYDNWGRLVSATLRREENRKLALRTPSDVSSVSSFSSSSYLGSFNGRISFFSSSSLLVGESFTYPQVLRATSWFSESKLIKRGHNGDLYFGVLQNGIQAVVKKVSVSSLEKELGLMSELEICGMVNHSRMVPLLGHCLENSEEKFLIYKYAKNKDLLSFLNGGIDDDGQSTLDWTTRLKIATQAAEGLCYLHHQCFPPLVHSDIQASSILLDDDFEVRLGSLGRVCIEETNNNQNRIARLLGFRTRNSGATNAITADDVYSFGKVLLELFTGKLGLSAANDTTSTDRTSNILSYIVSDDKNLIAKVVDPYLIKDEQLSEKVWAVAFLAKACLCPKPSKRPKMTEILKALEGLSKTSMKVCPYGEIYSHASPRIFTLKELNKITRSFGRKNWLGQDEFGTLYRGLLQEKSKSHGGTGSPVVVKKMHLRKAKSFQHWQAEVELLGRLSHPNILQLLGYCLEDNRLLLVYEFMPEGSLKKYFSSGCLAIRNLTWDLRLKILIGAARGLAFLQTLARQGFLPQKEEGERFYGYFRCSKILLDSDYNPKLTGFGVAEVDPPDNFFDVYPYSSSSGTYEYGAPDHISSGEANWISNLDKFVPVKSHLEGDGYGFGVILVRMLTGVEHAHHTHQIKRLTPLVFLERCMDPSLQGKVPTEAAVKIAQLAKFCLRRDPKKLRPSIEQIVEILEDIEKIQSCMDELNGLESKRVSKLNFTQDNGPIDQVMEIPKCTEEIKSAKDELNGQESSSKKVSKFNFLQDNVPIEQVVEITEGTKKIQSTKDDMNTLELSSKRVSKLNFIQDKSPTNIKDEGQEISEEKKGEQKQNAHAEKSCMTRDYKTIYISASRIKHQKSGFGGIVLDEKRSLINAWAICSDQNVSLVETGLQAIRYAQLVAEKERWKKVQIRLDVQGVVNEFIRKKQLDIISSRGLFVGWTFIYVPKEWNESCNRLADVAVENQTSQVWRTCFPSWLIESNQKGAIF